MKESLKKSGDSSIIQEAGYSVTEMLSGCVCCTLIGQLVNAIHKLEEELAPQLIVLEATLGLSSRMHDQAATVSATVRVVEGQVLPFARIVEAIGDVARKAEAAGGIVGHVKGYAETTGGFAHASCTDAALGVNAEGDSDLALGAKAKAQLVAIVRLVGLDDLERIVVDAFSQ